MGTYQVYTGNPIDEKAEIISYFIHTSAKEIFQNEMVFKTAGKRARELAKWSERSFKSEKKFGPESIEQSRRY